MATVTIPGTVRRVSWEGLDGSGSALVLPFPGLGLWVGHWGALGGVGGEWSPASVCRVTVELCSPGLGAMAEVGTIVDKVKEVLFQHGGFQQS